MCPVNTPCGAGILACQQVSYHTQGEANIPLPGAAKPAPFQVSYYIRRLPHWHPAETALFVTWRLHGSLPRKLEFFVADPEKAGRQFLRWDRTLDAAAHGPKWLRDARVARLVVDALHFAETELNLLQLWAWVVMPNHVHVLWQPRAPMKRIMRSVKWFTARKANQILDRTGQPFWQDESYDHWVRNRQELTKIINYIEMNPVKAGLVQSPEDWPWSSATMPEIREKLRA